jgi:NAD(P)-dependent dehydrogenase (short-subunit alcohol dehydrogenase family)
LGARNATKARDAITYIQEQLSTPVDIRHIPLDLASFASIRNAAEKFTSECDRLDILILNAGTMGNPPTTTEEGFEVQFGTNHVGHFLLTKLLLPVLQKTAASGPSADVRVVTVASMANTAAPSYDVMTSTDALLATSTWIRYAASKAANILFASELARRYPEILSVSIHPGAVTSNLYETAKASDPVTKYGLSALSLFFRSVRSGALNQLWAAGIKRELLSNGAYYIPIGINATKNKYATDADMAKRLWEWTEAQISEKSAS